MTRIIICDDHKIVREGLKQIVGVFPEFDVVGEAESAEALLQVLRKNETELLILDVSLPGRSGLEVIKQVRASYPEIRVLVLSMFPEDQFAIRMLKAGASGYLHKDSAPDVLHEALTTIAQGGEYLSPKISQLLYRQIHSNASELPHTTLNSRWFGPNPTSQCGGCGSGVSHLSTFPLDSFFFSRFDRQLLDRPGILKGILS